MRAPILSAVGLLALACTTGCECGSKKVKPRPLVRVAALETATLLERAGEEPHPGQRAIAAALRPSAEAVVLFDASGPRYVARSSGDGMPVKVCPSAGSVAALEDGVAVGCGVLGTDGFAVMLFDQELLPRATIALDSTGTPSVFGISWPVVNADASLAAVATTSGVEVFELPSGKAASVVVLPASWTEVSDILFDPPSERLAVASVTGEVRVHSLKDVSKPPLVLEPDRPDRAPSLAFSATGDRLAVASFWGLFRLYAADGELLRRDAGSESDYGHQGVAFVGGASAIVQLRGGVIVERDGDGVPTGAATQASPGSGTSMLGPFGFLSSSGESVVTISGDGMTSTVWQRAATGSAAR